MRAKDGWEGVALVPRRVSAKVAAEGFELRERRASS
jgi:hypothetical protein